MNKIRNKLFVNIGDYIKGTVHLLKINDYEKSMKQCKCKGPTHLRWNSDRKIGFFSGHSCL